MPDRCVAASCSNVADPSKGIFVQTIPFFGDFRPEAIKRRKKWVDFVKAKRAKWEPTNPRVIQITIFKCNVVLRDIKPSESSYWNEFSESVLLDDILL